MNLAFVTGIDPLALRIAILSLVIMVLSILIKKFKQPYVIAYILAGIILGPHGLRIFTDTSHISNLGSFGLIFLLFFVGSEISVPNLTKNFAKPLFGALMQVILSLLSILILGLYLNWSTGAIVLIGFIISLSSSAVIFRYLQENAELQTPLGQHVSTILLIQDILIVPMLVIINFMGSKQLEPHQLVITVVGAIIVLAFLRLVAKKKELKLPFPEELHKEHELQVFAGLSICVGFALLTSFFGLSTALGAFLAGILVAQAKDTKWLQQSMLPFQVFFLALFFVSVGLMIDLKFLIENYKTIAIILLFVFVINSFINAVIFRLMGESWRNSIYAGALLSQIGEFSFVLCPLGYSLHLIDDYTYQITLLVIALTMLMTSIWINIVKIFFFKEPSTLLRIVGLERQHRP